MDAQVTSASLREQAAGTANTVVALSLRVQALELETAELRAALAARPKRKATKRAKRSK